MSDALKQNRTRGILIVFAISITAIVLSMLFSVPALSAGSRPNPSAGAGNWSSGVGQIITPTATFTGTITPDPTLSVTVVPTTTFVGQTLTFTITVKNVGTAPMLNGFVNDAFPAFIDIQSVTSTQGTSTNSLHSLTATIGTIMPNETVTITVVVKVNSSLTVTTTVQNQVALAFDSGQTRTASVNYTVQPPAPTPTSTVTPTSTATPTNTATVTKTATPTPTGTLPTPTATGTITPNPTVTVSVSPSEAKVNQSFTFTIKVTNGGTAPTTAGIISNSFPSYIDVDTVTTSKGSATKTAHAFSVNVGGLAPGETVTIFAIVKVNSSLTRSETVTDQVVFTYDNNLSRAATTSYKVVATTTIPATGQISLLEAAGLEAARSSATWLYWIFALLALGVGGLLSVAGMQPGKLRRGVTFAALLLLAAVAVACMSKASPTAPAIGLEGSQVVLGTTTPTLLPYMPASAFSTPEPIVTLPSYPIPTPEVLSTQAAGEPAPDTSPIRRIVIPALGLDTVVAYVPYDEDKMSWLIDGLREEVAWLGETSWPGLGGNTVLAGHITVRGLGNGPFRYLENLAVGDQVTVYTDENVYTYKMREQVSVDETDLGVLLPTTQAQLTLITCTGWDTELNIYRYRRVVFADLVHTEPVVRQGIQ